MYYDSTIAAVSTPRAAGGISVIRISGEKAIEIADKIFKPVSCDIPPIEMKGYTCAYGKFIGIDGSELDDGILTVFRAPRSYTGENIAELSCHGGIYVTERVLRTVYELGAEPAGAGEFTKRAFLNKKLTLTQAEAVMDIISAEGKGFHRRAVNVKEGALYRRIRKSSDKLLGILGEIGAWVDYPDEDIPELENDTLCVQIKDILSELDNIRSIYDNSRILRTGIDTVIAGKPNVGKSTLMNLLSGCDRSIVTDEAGTTRDIVEESVRLGDLVLKLSDTAGLRQTDSIAEGAGIEKARNKMQTADLIIAVFDNGEVLDDNDMELIGFCKNADGVKVIACINKNDRECRLDRKIIDECFENIIEISAKNGLGMDMLQNVLNSLFLTCSNISDELTVNERQKICLDKAAAALDIAIADIERGITLDAVNIVLDDALNALLELTGERVTEAVTAEIFSHFCVGK